MRKLIVITAFISLFLSPISFAFAGENDASPSQCDPVAKACKSAGFTDEGMGEKSFWFGCMKPLLYGTSVNGVAVDNKDVQACRNAKIEKMQKEVKDLQDVKN